ncbi:hypothetical protein [Streptomyces sp. NPDC006739]|uniref:hypothetical protein n=1 Tax=Streptomyces sp. NPDC006739 TaxID=3364763 RepID=UPI0036BB6622
MTEQQTPVPDAVDDRPPLPGTAPLPAPGDRRVLRTVLRWTTAAVVFAAVGTSTAYGITLMDRTDLPGLATRADGRWDYPQIVRPPLPAGSPAPFADRNAAFVHYADLRELVLPAPKGAKPDPALAGDHGWVKPQVFLAEYATDDDRDALQGELTNHGLRHIAGRGWTMPDGTRTRIYLLQFETGLIAGEVQEDEFAGYDEPTHALRGAPTNKMDDSFPTAATTSGHSLQNAYVEQKPYGAEQVKQAYLYSGDVIGVVVQSRKGDAKEIPFQQTVVLQRELLD